MRAFLYFMCAALQGLTGALHDGMSTMQIFIAILGSLGAGATALKAAISPNGVQPQQPKNGDGGGAPSLPQVSVPLSSNASNNQP